MAVPAAKIDLSYTLDDKYALDEGRIYLSGIQALVRLPLMQRQRDAAAGLDTGGFISGYRGSPLGGLDLNLWRAKKFLEKGHIHFVPGLNEDLAATMVWGSQQVNLWPGARHDGVFAMWYGKGPGVDRAGDVFKHGNAAGSSRNGGVLALAGDDHACRSSTLPHQSEHEFLSAMIPILNPAGVQEIMDLGIYGWALSRFSGRWVGFKTIAETVESSASVYADPHRVEIVTPEDFELPPGGLNIRWPDDPLSQEKRLHQYSLHAARAFCRANKLDRVMLDSPNPRLGIMTTGKSYLDVLDALQHLGIDKEMARDIGIRVYKVGMTWPLEPDGVRAFAEGLEDILVVEEKRAFLEKQLKEQLYNWRSDVRPSVVGKYDEEGNWILPSISELTPATIAQVIAKRLDRFFTSERVHQRLAFLEQKEQELARPHTTFHRSAHFCSGCPHNTSTNVPEGSRAMAGIGCHYMTVWMDRRTETFTQMGGEGTPWIGQAPFTDTDHVFVNLGDGTYFHSGTLAIRACVASGVNITFKILYNDAVAMTGGQPVDGPLSVPQIAQQVRGEGVQVIRVVSDEPDKWSDPSIFPAGVSFHHRDDLDQIQRELRESKGTSVLIYDQTCAAEKRRRRKRGLMEDPAKRTFINELVCEGCGDCGVQSNCLSIVPVETEFGRKRAIDQSGCNKDFSCIKGFCPSFVTIHGGQPRKRRGTVAEPDFSTLPMPVLPSPADHPYGILITGVGGTGVVTIGALLGMAAHLENKGVTVLDQTGLAQKYGAVTSHVRIAEKPEDIHAVRIAAGEADLVLGCDMAVAGSAAALAKMRRGDTVAIINSHDTMPGSFTQNPDLVFPHRELVESIEEACGSDAVDLVEGTLLATSLMGDSIATNLFMLGYAWQQGRVPVSLDALMRAIELNGVAVDANKRAFGWGRYAAHDIEAVREAASPPTELRPRQLASTLDEMVERRIAFLTAYQNSDYAQRYADLVQRVASREKTRTPGKTELSEAVARYYFKLLAYKDEYEVARLFTQTGFMERLKDTFEGNFKVHFNLAPPLFAKRDPVTGHLRKKEYGRWVYGAFTLLARLRWLRGTPFDVFGYSAERRMERQLIREYEDMVEELLKRMNYENHCLAVEIASLPERIRGFGHVKDAHLAETRRKTVELLAAFGNVEAAAGAA